MWFYVPMLKMITVSIRASESCFVKVCFSEPPAQLCLNLEDSGLSPLH